MKLYIHLLLIALPVSAPLLAGGLLGAASNVVHGAANIATGTTDAVLGTTDRVVGTTGRVLAPTEGVLYSDSEVSPIAYEEEQVSYPLDYEEEDTLEEEISPDELQEESTSQRPFID